MNRGRQQEFTHLERRRNVFMREARKQNVPFHVVDWLRKNRPQFVVPRFGRGGKVKLRVQRWIMSKMWLETRGFPAPWSRRRI